MEIAGFTVHVSELDGVRLVENIYPERIEMSKLAPYIASFLELWEDPSPAVALSDVRRLREIGDDVRPFAVSVLQRLRLNSNLVASAWCTGGNEPTHSQLIDLLADVKGSERAVFRTREEAIDYLRGRIAMSNEQ
jgi:hypothetical protein